jgi:hypothetical protein
LSRLTGDNAVLAAKAPKPKHLMSGLILRIVGGWLLVGSGLVLLPLPVPVGWLFVVAGVTMLAHDNRRLSAWLRRLRRRNPGFSHRLQRLEPHTPGLMRRLLKRTDPGPRPPGS